jgi:hypothetical protein
MAANRIVSRNARIIATNAAEIAVTSNRRKACRKRLSVITSCKHNDPLVDRNGACAILCARAFAPEDECRSGLADHRRARNLPALEPLASVVSRFASGTARSSNNRGGARTQRVSLRQ